MSVIRIVIADDQSLFSESLARVLESRTKDVRVVAVAADGDEAVRCVERTRPQIVLMDVRMPGTDGIEATRLIHERHPGTKVMMLTTFDDDQYVYDSIEHGAVGYVLKSTPLDELIACIRALSVGTIQISPAIARKLVKRAIGSGAGSERGPPQSELVREALQGLTKRESEIIELALKAFDNREIADRLCVSPQTVKNHLSVLYSKFGVSNRLQLIRTIESAQKTP